MTPAQLSDALLHTVRRAVDSGQLDVPVPPRAVVRRPRHGEGDWATALALQLAGPAGRPAREVAGVLRDGLAGAPGVRAVEVTGPGYLTVRVADTAGGEVLREVLATAPPEPLPEDPARDAAGWAAATGRGATDPELLVQRESNPLFRVRYAHARCRALPRGGCALGVRPQPGAGGYGYRHPAEAELLALLTEWSRHAAGPPDRLARYLDAVAVACADVRAECPALPRGDEKPTAVHRARLALAQAAGTVLADGLTRLGVSAPDRL